MHRPRAGQRRQVGRPLRRVLRRRATRHQPQDHHADQQRRQAAHQPHRHLAALAASAVLAPPDHAPKRRRAPCHATRRLCCEFVPDLRRNRAEAAQTPAASRRREQLRRTLASTNPIESMIEIVRRTSRNAKHWSSGDTCLRWTAAGILEAEQQFRKTIGHGDRDILRTSRPATTDTPPSELARPDV